MTSDHQEVLTSLVARYETVVSIQDRIVEHDRRFGLVSELERPTGAAARLVTEGPRRPGARDWAYFLVPL